MVNVKTVSDYINSFAAYDSCCDWDNCGILVGDGEQAVKKIGLCLDLTNETFKNAKDENVDLIITHHPLIFTPQKNFLAGDKSFELVKAGMSLISIHTPFDCAQGGVNDVLCEIFGLTDVKGIDSDETKIPMARIGSIKTQSSTEFASFVAQKLDTVCRVVNCNNTVSRVAVCGGAGMDFFDDVIREGADAYVTGEIKHHEMLYAKEKGITIIDAGHFKTENPSMVYLKNKLEKDFKEVEFVMLKQSSPVEFIG